MRRIWWYCSRLIWSTVVCGLGGVSFISQLIGTALAIAIALAGGFIVYGLLKATIGIRLSQEDEFRGADLSIHKISANSEEGMF